MKSKGGMEWRKQWKLMNTQQKNIAMGKIKLWPGLHREHSTTKPPREAVITENPETKSEV